MVPLTFLRVALVSTLLFTSVSGHCTTPKVRKEWRCLSPDERASWLNAIKVFVPLAQVFFPLLNFATQVSCQVTAQSKHYSHCGPRDFVDPTHLPE